MKISSIKGCILPGNGKTVDFKNPKSMHAFWVIINTVTMKSYHGCFTEKKTTLFTTFEKFCESDTVFPERMPPFWVSIKAGELL